jgi:hypothetical protein
MRPRRGRDIAATALGVLAGGILLGGFWLWEEEARWWVLPELRLLQQAWDARDRSDHQAAADAHRRLAETRPDLAEEHRAEAAWHLCRLGRADEALAALGRDHTPRFTSQELRRCLADAGRLSEAIALQRRQIEALDGPGRWRRLAALQAERPTGPLPFHLESERIPIRLVRSNDGHVHCPRGEPLGGGCGAEGRRLACLGVDGRVDAPETLSWSCPGSGAVRAEVEELPAFALCGER